jgi:hypothetical protein
LRGERGAEVGVEEDAEERQAARETAAVGEGGIVGQYGTDAGEDGVGGMTKALHFGASGRASKPVGLIGLASLRCGSQIAVYGEGSLEGDEGPVVLDEVGERLVEVAGRLLKDSGGGFDSGGS